MMRGTLEDLPKWQGKVENDWRDEQPGRMLHEAHTGPLTKLYYTPRSGDAIVYEDYASLIESNIPIVVQHTRLDSRQVLMHC
jgi:hypothetical protein